MKRLFQEQIGKLLLVLAFVWGGLTVSLFPVAQASFPEEQKFVEYQKMVRVPYTPGQLAPAEVFFPMGEADEYRRDEAALWVRKKTKQKVFEGIPDLPEVTRARIIPAPKLLTDPGPSLKGADKLPRWNQDLPPLNVPAKKGTTGTKPTGTGTR